MADKLCAAETFLGGGTNFQTPMNEALRLMEAEGFENADIVFVTDGECELPDQYLEQLRAEQTARRFTVTGVLLDKGTPGMAFRALSTWARQFWHIMPSIKTFFAIVASSFAILGISALDSSTGRTFGADAEDAS